ncbi:MAG: PUR family DNA/RNA-binding protein [Bacteroidia bacterium]|nr:PUR family DNA/RNA-binding protein [Bacteroidia bacterium]
MEGYERNEENLQNDREEIYSKAVRAGKRTYFFDVKSTRKDDYYLTITESKKRIAPDGKMYYEKHKLFLYKEDFEKFADGLDDVINFIKNNNFTQDEQVNDEQSSTPPNSEVQNSDFSNISYDDLEAKK